MRMRTIGRWSVASFISVVLGFLRFGVALSLIIAAFATTLLPFIPMPKVTVTVPVSFSLETPTSISAGRMGFGFQILNEKEQAKQDRNGRLDRVNGSLKIPAASKSFIAANAVVLIVILAFVLYVIDQLRAVLRTLIHGNPFVAENAIRIRRVACAVIIGEFARSLIVFAENHYAMTNVAIAGLQFDAWPRVSFGTIIHGLIILVIAEVFRAGTRLDEEQSLTI
jgi:Protein of unknown function (DUF2975)